MPKRLATLKFHILPRGMTEKERAELSAMLTKIADLTSCKDSGVVTFDYYTEEEFAEVVRTGLDRGAAESSEPNEGGVSDVQPVPEVQDALHETVHPEGVDG